MAGLVPRAAADGAKLIFGITSPYLNNVTINSIIETSLNPGARALMDQLDVPTVDLYAAITNKCGDVPQAACFGLTGCFSPHCNAAGYSWLADTVIAPAIRTLL